MTSEEFDKCLSCYREQIDAELHAIIDESDYPSEFREILEYALFPGGKRLRPMLVLEWHALFSPPDNYALRYACGVEILHSYSLVHDDMPCMDNDELRRGKPTVHKAFGEGRALLAGDALMDMAYGILGTPTPSAEPSPFAVLSPLCGDNGIIGGQYSDLYGRPDTKEKLLDMYGKKTGALIKMACLSGYALGKNLGYSSFVKLNGMSEPDIGTDADERTVLGHAAVSGFGEAFGRAFQLYDDITEYIGGEKSDGTSIMNFADLDEAKRMLNRGLNDAAGFLRYFGDGTEFLQALLNKFVIV